MNVAFFFSKKVYLALCHKHIRTKISVVDLKMFQKILEVSTFRKTRDFAIADLDQALIDLKKKKSRDPDGLVNEIFKHEASLKN